MDGCKSATLCEQYTTICIERAKELGTWNLQQVFQDVADIYNVKKHSIEKLVSYYTKTRYGMTAKEYIIKEVQKNEKVKILRTTIGK